ncbi:MAG TPA: hypothetical protein VFF52_14685 [Isosphaeraceae bacterium]|nr:hypothetical protein [Isosphaeraceae bacterium]
MPESTCLHIQDRESGPIRVVELPWISVRIGRAAYCEVRLPDADVGQEVCRLTRRGRTWSLIPSTGQGPILLEGRPLEGACPLPFDVPFRLGPYCLTLRRDVAAEPDWEMYPGPAPVQLPAPTTTARDAGVGERPAADREPLERGAAARPESAGDAGRWHARWQAAAAHLAARSQRLRNTGEVQRAASQPGLDVVPVKEPKAVRPRGPVAPLIDPTARPIPAPRPPKVEAVPEARPASLGGQTWRDRLGGSSGHRWRDSGDVRSGSEGGPPPAIHPAQPAARSSQTEPEGLPDPGTPESRGDPPAAAPPVSGVSFQTAAARSGAAALPEHDSWAASQDHRQAHAEDQAPPARPPSDRSEPEPEPGRDPDAPHGRMDQESRVGPRFRGGGPIEDSDPVPDRSGSIRSVPSRRGAGPSGREVEWPSVQDILASHQPGSCLHPATISAPSTIGQAIPTEPRAPAAWDLPVWLAWPPVAVVVLIAGLAGCVLSWSWAIDSQSAAIMTNRLLLPQGPDRRRPLPDWVIPPEGAWLTTTAQHLAHWAVFLSDGDGDPRRAGPEISSLLERALQVSPLNPTARLALAQLERRENSGVKPSRSLGLSRDAVSLAWSARVLLAAGKKEAALRLFTQALSAAARSGRARGAVPRFHDDETVLRYLLPGEEQVRDIVGELAAQTEWPFAEWSRALPRHPTALLATARLLREQGRREAEPLLDLILDDPRPTLADPTDDPYTLAARAEALALRARFRDAQREYRLAIERIDNERIRRSWWFNLADIAFRLNDEGERQAALRAALAVAESDDITRRAARIQSAATKPPQLRLGNAKAN